MMNDRFSVELRQHLLATGDERPGDGRLAAIVDGVAVTGQRHPVLARLPWSPAGSNPFPSAAMRYGVIAAALIIAIVGAALLAGGGFSSRSVFSGTWSSTDPADGSDQTLVIGAGTSPSVHFEDDFATGLACREDAVKVFTADGTGQISDDTLDATFPDGGGCGSTTVEIALHLVYDRATDSLRDQDGLVWLRVSDGDGPATPSPASTSPTTEPSQGTESPSMSATPTPDEGEATFTSAIHGFSMRVPKGWQTRAATEPWTGEPLDFDSPAADVIFDPATKDGLYLLVASRSFGGISGDAWRASVLEWTCAGDNGHEFWGWKVDGIYSEQFGPCNSGSIIQTDTRGYLFRLVAPRAEKLGLTDTWDSLKPLLETVDLRPEDATDPPGAAKPLPACAEIAPGAIYMNHFGTPRLSATVPLRAKISWQGSRDAFALGGSCPGAISITASTVDTILTDPCDPTAGVGGNIATPAEAAEAMAAHIGHQTSEPTDVTIDGHDALRVEISTEGSTCTDPFALWPGTEVAPGQNALIYLVDTGEEHPLGIGVWYSGSDATPAQLAEAEAIVKSIQINP